MLVNRPDLRNARPDVAVGSKGDAQVESGICPQGSNREHCVVDEGDNGDTAKVLVEFSRGLDHPA